MTPAGGPAFPARWDTQSCESVTLPLSQPPPADTRTVVVSLAANERTGLRFLVELTGDDPSTGYRLPVILEWQGANEIVLPAQTFEPFGDRPDWSRVRSVRLRREEPSCGEVIELRQVAFSPRHLLRSVNPYEDMLEAFWMPQTWRPEEWVVRSNLPDGRYALEQDWFHGYLILREPGPGSWISTEKTYPGGIDVSGHVLLALSISFAVFTRCDIDLKIDGTWQPVIQEHCGANAYEELTAGLGGAHTLDGMRMRMTCTEAQPASVKGVVHWILLQRRGIDEETIRRHAVASPMPYTGPGVPPRRSGSGVRSPRCQAVLTTGLYFTADDLPALRKKARSGPGKAVWEKIQAKADAYLTYDPEPHVGEFLPRRRAGLTRRFVEEAPNWNTMIPELGLAYWITGDEKYARKCKEIVLAACRCSHWGTCFMDRFPTGIWGYRAPFWPAGTGWAVAIGTDWIGHLLSEQERSFVHQALIDKCIFPVECYLDRMPYCRSMNQGVIFSVGALLASRVVQETRPEFTAKEDKFAQYLLDVLDRYVGEDGATGEGASYWAYTMQAAVVALSARPRAGYTPMRENLPDKVMRSVDYILYLRSHTGSDLRFLNIGDYCMGAFNMSPVWLFFANRLGRRDLLSVWQETFGEPDRLPDDVFSFLLFEPDAQPEPLDLPVNRCFENAQRVFWRTGWDPSSDTLFLFESGPWGPDHYHLDKHHFMLDAFGERFALDPGIGDYSDPEITNRIATYRHNTVTVDRRDQVAAPHRPAAKILEIKHTAEFCYLRSEANDAYANLDRFRREVVFLRPYAFLISDEVEGFRGKIEWHFHSPYTPEPTGRGFLFRGRQGRLRLDVVLPEEWDWKHEQYTTDRADVTDHHLSLSPVNARGPCRFLIVLLLEPGTGPDTRGEAV